MKRFVSTSVPQWKNRITRKQPPGVGKPFPVFVPQSTQMAMISAAFACPSSTSDRHLHRLESDAIRNPACQGNASVFSFVLSAAEKPTPPPPPRRIAQANRRALPISRRLPAKILRRREEARRRSLPLQDDIQALINVVRKRWEYITK